MMWMVEMKVRKGVHVDGGVGSVGGRVTSVLGKTVGRGMGFWVSWKRWARVVLGEGDNRIEGETGFEEVGVVG